MYCQTLHYKNNYNRNSGNTLKLYITQSFFIPDFCKRKNMNTFKFDKKRNSRINHSELFSSPQNIVNIYIKILKVQHSSHLYPVHLLTAFILPYILIFVDLVSLFVFWIFIIKYSTFRIR